MNEQKPLDIEAIRAMYNEATRGYPPVPESDYNVLPTEEEIEKAKSDILERERQNTQ